MSIGYACLTVGVQNTDFKKCILKNASESKLRDLIYHNLDSLENIIDYNIKNNIKLYRISSDLIPFGSSYVNTVQWQNEFSKKLQYIGNKIRSSGMRVSMHPGQYTVLNSPNKDVVARSIDDLNYHALVLDSIGVGPEHKIILHIGGIYNDKPLAKKRFISHYKELDDKVKQRLVIENDDKSYNIFDVLEIGQALNIPVVFDNLHNKINNYNTQVRDAEWINECKKTWSKVDGNQKIHYSQQNPFKRSGSHSNTIEINEFMDFYKSIDREDIDIMLEVKDKNLSAMKCINCTATNRNIKALELEWSKYKYSILERSPSDYLKIRELLKDKKQYPAIDFYNIVENALQKPIDIGNAINAIEHVWGYFKGVATDKEKQKILKEIQNYKQGKGTIGSIKNSLRKIAIKYKEDYLLDSYYFEQFN